jgi:hypothetical protein
MMVGSSHVNDSIKGSVHEVRNVSGEGHLTVKFPPPKKRVRGIGY